jgi:hypothetical protein
MLVIEIALGVALGILLAAGLRKLLPRVQWRRIADRMFYKGRSQGKTPLRGLEVFLLLSPHE